MTARRSAGSDTKADSKGKEKVARAESQSVTWRALVSTRAAIRVTARLSVGQLDVLQLTTQEPVMSVLSLI